MVVIGDEVLTGSIADCNTPFLAKLLHSRGVDLVRAEFVPDCKRDIVETVLRLRERVGPDGFVFTSGGIGPTHDDITYESIAAAYGAELHLHQPTVERMAQHYSQRGVELNEARLRMARLPSDGKATRGAPRPGSASQHTASCRSCRKTRAVLLPKAIPHTPSHPPLCCSWRGGALHPRAVGAAGGD
jgi:molybdenum cofactor synthesis domain-containing protein